MDHQFNNGQQEPDDDTGSAESYQCVFCKRGFTNAQALGGHMNIHRRDRARMSNSTTSTSSVANKHHQNHTMLNHVPSISSNQNREIRGYLRPNSSYSLGDDSKTPRNYCHTYFPPPPPRPPPPSQLSSMSNNKHFHHQRPQHQQHYQQQQQQPLSLFQEDRSYTGLELRIGNPSIYIEEVKRQDDEEEEEIDLELRLGHDN